MPLPNPPACQEMSAICLFKSAGCPAHAESLLGGPLSLSPHGVDAKLAHKALEGLKLERSHMRARLKPVFIKKQSSRGDQLEAAMKDEIYPPQAPGWARTGLSAEPVTALAAVPVSSLMAPMRCMISTMTVGLSETGCVKICRSTPCNNARLITIFPSNSRLGSMHGPFYSTGRLEANRVARILTSVSPDHPCPLECPVLLPAVRQLELHHA